MIIRDKCLYATDEIMTFLREISQDSPDYSVCLDADALCRLVLSLRSKIELSKEFDEYPQEEIPTKS